VCLDARADARVATVAHHDQCAIALDDSARALDETVEQASGPRSCLEFEVAGDIRHQIVVMHWPTSHEKTQAMSSPRLASVCAADAVTGAQHAWIIRRGASRRGCASSDQI
jgi:hypothetical protein